MADGDDFILGQGNDATSETTIHRAPANIAGAALTVINDLGEGISSTGGPNSSGVFGLSQGGFGVEGQSGDNVGVFGFSDSGVGVQGNSRSTAGLLGESTTGNGVWGTGTNSTGVLGGGFDYGVNGVAGGLANSAGVYGRSPNATGVIGSGGNIGILALNLNNPNIGAVFATHSEAGLFFGNVAVLGDFRVFGTTKSVVVQHPDGSHRQLYCMESPEGWFEDFGVGQLHNGHAHVQLGRDFAALVRTDHYHVFLTPYGESNGLYVADILPDSFVVREQQGGQHSLQFTYRVAAKRRDVDVVRLQPVQVPDKLLAPLIPPPPAQEPPQGARPQRRPRRA
jgi:hypothetical protein